MSFEVKIPAVGESVTSGMIAAWLKNDGDTVAKGEALFSLETDKVSTEITADAAGTLRIKAAAGSEVKIGEVVALIESGASTPAPKAPETPKEPSQPKAAEPAPAAAPRAPEPSTLPVLGGTTPIPQPASPAPAAPAAAPAAPPPPAAEPSPAPAAAPAATTASGGRTTRRRLSPLRRKIAAQLVMAQHTAAILTTFNEVDLSAVVGLRKSLGEDFQKQHGVKLGFMSFFIKAAVSALKAVPQVNVRVEGEDVVENHFQDIGVAVGTERGLVVPVIRDADRKSFADIERDLAAYATKAREGKITTEDLSGGVFTISNGGIYGSLLSTPILNPPQSGILGMHKIQERPIAVDGQVVVRPMMYLALSYDHRVVDGKEAVTFLVRIKDAIEQPARLLVGI